LFVWHRQIFLLEFQFHFIPSLNGLRSPKSHQFLYISLVLASLINQFHFGKSNTPLIRRIMPIKIMIHVRCPIEKNKVGASSLMFCKFIPSWLGWTLYPIVRFSSRDPFSLTFSVVSRSSRSKCSLLLLNYYLTLPNRMDKSFKSFAMLTMLESISEIESQRSYCVLLRVGMQQNVPKCKT